MLKAVYNDGSVYQVEDFGQIDFSKFKVDGLKHLMTGTFSFDMSVHGKPVKHFLRRGMKLGESKPSVNCYAIETDKWKIFCFDNGSHAVLKDYDPGSTWLSAPLDSGKKPEPKQDPQPKPSSGNDDEDKATDEEDDIILAPQPKKGGRAK